MDASRRNVLGLAAAAAAAVAIKPSVAEAADGQNVKLGMENLAENKTYITGGRNGGLVVTSITDDGSVVGVNTADDGVGVRGTGTYVGMDAIGGQIGLLAGSEVVALQAETWAGTAVLAKGAGPGSTALDVKGTAKFSTAGRVRVPTGANKVVLTGLSLRPTSMVLATIQAHKAGLYVEGVQIDVAGGTATIWLSKPTTGQADIGWFLIG
jgi:hypothetical protein